MSVLKLKTNDCLIIDPCYVKQVTSCGNPRFDALRCVKVLHEGSDGCYGVELNSKLDWKGFICVDSGRIWVLKAEFDCEVEKDSGGSGFIKISGMSDGDIEKIKLV